MRMSEYLEIIEDEEIKKVKCVKCDFIYGPASKNVKNMCKMKTFPITKAGPLVNPWVEMNDFELREFYCPKCATMFTVELNKKGEPLVWDIEMAV